MSDYSDLLAHFSDPERHRRITSAPGFNPRRAIWLTDDNIAAMARDKEFVATFRRLYGTLEGK